MRKRATVGSGFICVKSAIDLNGTPEEVCASLPRPPLSALKSLIGCVSFWLGAAATIPIHGKLRQADLGRRLSLCRGR
jgi:hypothetical protein